MIWEIRVSFGDRYLTYTAETTDGFPYCNAQGFFKVKAWGGNEEWINSRYIISMAPRRGAE